MKRYTPARKPQQASVILPCDGTEIARRWKVNSHHTATGVGVTFRPRVPMTFVLHPTRAGIEPDDNLARDGFPGDGDDPRRKKPSGADTRRRYTNRDKDSIAVDQRELESQ